MVIQDTEDNYYALRMNKNLNSEEMQMGQSLTIPYFKIFRNYGDELKKHLSKDKHENVYIKVDLSLQNPDNRVEYELWYSSMLDLNLESMEELATYQDRFGR